MQNNQTVKIITGSTTSVALVNTDGTGSVISLQQVANQLARQEAQVTSTQALVSAITALGLTLPAAN